MLKQVPYCDACPENREKPATEHREVKVIDLRSGKTRTESLDLCAADAKKMDGMRTRSRGRSKSSAQTAAAAKASQAVASIPKVPCPEGCGQMIPERGPGYSAHMRSKHAEAYNNGTTITRETAVPAAV